MNDHEMVPLPDDVAAALATERARDGVDAETRARLRARLRASLSGGGAPDDPPPFPEVEPAAPRRLLHGLRALHPALTASVGFVIGVTAGMAVQARLDATRVRVPEMAPVVQANSSSSRIATEPPLPAPSAPSTPGEATTSRDVRPQASAPSAPTLTAERALLDIAHTELAKGEAAAALDGLNQHAQRFPRGVYREEREALMVQSLRALGRTEEAARRAAAFKAHYPKSLFLSTVEIDSPANP